MTEFIQNYSLYIVLGLALVAMMVWSNRSRQKMREQQDLRNREMAEQMVPGAWVKTAVGFWGRFVDEDGDVIVLETQDGTEMYWDRAMIREVGVEPPFAQDATVGEAEETEPEPRVLGMDSPDSPIETDDKN